MNSRTRTNRVMLWLLPGACLLLGAWALPIGGAGEADPEPPPAPADTATAATLTRVSLDPQALSAAGLSTGEVSELVSDAYAYLAQNPTELSSADADYADARRDVDSLRRKAKSGLATAEEVTDLAAAKTALAAATSARDAALDGLFDAAVADLSQAKQDLLANIRKNRGWGFACCYLVADRSEADWVKLRDALANEKISAKLGEAADPSCSSFLGSVKGETAVSAAIVAQGSGLSGVKGAWNTALSQ